MELRINFLKRFLRIKKLTISQQLFKLINCWRSGKIIYQSYKQIIWRCELRPTALSRYYEVTLIYRLNGLPEVYVKRDDLVDVDAADFPHIYKREKNRVKLCLYYGKEFNTSMYISDTIIPWTVEWLFYYELWIKTKIWFGGGIHPVPLEK